MDYTDCEECCLLGYDVMYSGRHTPALWKKSAAPVFGTQETDRSLKRRYVYTRLHGVTHQKTEFFITLRSSNLTSIVIFMSEVI